MRMMMMLMIIGTLATIALCVGPVASKTKLSFPLQSAAFANGATIPQKYSYNGFGCAGKNVSPALHWSGAPAATKSLALTVFDPDANNGKGWWHWVLYNIRAGVRDLPEGATKVGDEGPNDFGSTGYGGPCPPPGDTSHHYVFTLYALDTMLSGKLSGPKLMAAITGHVLASGALVGRFGR